MAWTDLTRGVLEEFAATATRAYAATFLDARRRNLPAMPATDNIYPVFIKNMNRDHAKQAERMDTNRSCKQCGERMWLRRMDQAYCDKRCRGRAKEARRAA